MTTDSPDLRTTNERLLDEYAERSGIPSDDMLYIRLLLHKEREAERERCAVIAEIAATRAWGNAVLACQGVAMMIRTDPAKGK